MFDERNFVNPFDAVDWRWQRVEALCTNDRLPGKDDDKWVRRGFKFLRALRATTNKLDQYEVTLDHKEVAEAFSWYISTTMRRQFLEALTLCDDLMMEDQADYLGVSLKMLKTYEALFFDVRERKNDKGFLCTRILEPAVISELHNAKNPVMAWKLCAIYGGFQVVKACWEYKGHPAEVNQFHRDAGISQLYKNFGLTQYFRPVDRFSMSEITEQLLRVLELETKKAEQEALGGPDIQMRANVIQQILTAGNFWLTDPDQEHTDGREPRLKEVVATAAQNDQGKALAQDMMQLPVSSV
jgi:hypothetical protein